ncbi:MAG: ATP-binding protein [bacterium]
MVKEEMNQSSCAYCNGTEWEIVVENGLEVTRKCRCYREKRRTRLLREARIPERYRHCNIDNFEVHHPSLGQAREITKRFVHEYPAIDVGLLFMGNCGVGKTHLAVGIIRYLTSQKGVPCIFYDFRDLLKAIQSTYSPESGASESAILEPVLTREILVLDELGAKKMSDWVRDTITHIINRRYNDRKITIITSNILDQPNSGDEGLVDRIGYRLRSRLYEMCRVVNMEGPDFRKAVKQAGFQFA